MQLIRVEPASMFLTIKMLSYDFGARILDIAFLSRIFPDVFSITDKLSYLKYFGSVVDGRVSYLPALQKKFSNLSVD